jgi:hypothetical protein
MRRFTNTYSAKTFFQFCREFLQSQIFCASRKIRELEEGESLAYFSAYVCREEGLAPRDRGKCGNCVRRDRLNDATGSIGFESADPNLVEAP